MKTTTLLNGYLAVMSTAERDRRLMAAFHEKAQRRDRAAAACAQVKS